MPGKGRRVASRQAELGRRRRRQNRAGGNTAESSSAAENLARSGVATEERQAQPEPAATKSAPDQSRPTPSPQLQRTASRPRLDRPAAYNYVMPEIRRILIMGGVLLAVLIGISVAVPYII